MKLLKKYAYYFYSLFELLFGVMTWPKVIGLFAKKSQPGEHCIKLWRPSLKFYVRDRMDVWSIKETFLDRFYTRYGTTIKNGWVVVDIGAGIGDFSILAAYENPNAKVFAFEPFPQSFKLLLKNLDINTIENVMPINQAVWSGQSQLTLDLSRDQPLQIRSQDHSEEEDSKNSIAVDAVSLEDMIETYHLDQIDLLKLDCEGAEYEILMKTPAETLAMVKRIIMEYHDLDNTHNHQKLRDFLKTSGFVVEQFDNFVHDDIGYLYAERQT